MTDTPVVVDLSPAEPLSEPEIRAWASQQRVFISSVMFGMEQERLSAADAIRHVGAEPIWFENFGGRDDDAESAYLSEVAAADIYLGILGERYGTPLKSGYSATHAEYREAIQQGLRMSVWAHDGALSGPQRDFLNEVRVFRTTGLFSSPEDLAEGVSRRLRAMAAEDLSPWAKVGHVVLRARRIQHDGSRIEIDARVRDRDVLAAIEDLRPDGTWRTSDDLAVSWAGRTVFVRLDAVTTETGAGRGAEIKITGKCVERANSSMIDMAFNGRTPEDLTELAVRIALFGEENPLGPMTFMAKLDNPFEVIDRLQLPADAVEPIASLLLTESLVGSGRAERISHLAVGRANKGVRRIELEWLPRRRHSNTTTTRRRVEGEIKSKP
jgi:hypothetical protein